MTHYTRAEPTDIHDLIWNLCETLGVEDPNEVARIEILPGKATVESYQRGDGKIHQLADGTPAMLIREIPVKT